MLSPHEVPWRHCVELPEAAQIEDGALYSLSLSQNTAALTHGLHRFAAKYIPQIPRWAVSQLAPGATVLDPFCGSGTTLVECLTRPLNVIGADIDPLARMITRAKLGKASVESVVRFARTLSGRWKADFTVRGLPMGDVNNSEHWFTPEATAWLWSLLHLIQRARLDADTREFLLVVFSSILRRVSNADDQSQKTYVSGTLLKRPAPVNETFIKALGRALDGLMALQANKSAVASAMVLEGADARHLGLADQSVDLICTSPPYTDSVDYAYNNLVEYFWLGPTLGVSTRPALNQIRKLPVGTKATRSPIRLKEKVVGELAPQRDRTIIVEQYFNDMSVHFQEAARVLKDEGAYVLVVGNSSTAGEQIPVHEELVKRAESQGLFLQGSFGYRIRRHYMKFPRKGRGGIIGIDWVMTLRKRKSKRKSVSLVAAPKISFDTHQVAH